ncbi:T9SS type A sorting domain-containing protein [Candidatus Latescibacterota bacterium]
MIRVAAMVLVGLCLTVISVEAKHNTGRDCLSCHESFAVAGSVFFGESGVIGKEGTAVSLTNEDGGQVVLNTTDSAGNFMSAVVPDGAYRIRVGKRISRSWHTVPVQGSCNICHIPGGNSSESRYKPLPEMHTALPSDNDCTHCHHFPASMSYHELQTSGVLDASREPPSLPDSMVEIAGKRYPFESSEYDIETVRPDIFAPGYFSMFDVILAVAEKNGLEVEYHYDESRKSHFISTIDDEEADYWYHFSYDAGVNRSHEIDYRRAYRWDEALWRHGVWIQVVTGENLDEIREEYLDEITRENEYGHVVPLVRIAVVPSDFGGNPAGSGRVSARREFHDVKVTAHNYRATGFQSPYSKPFQPGVVTSLDILLSLMDQGELNLVTSVFYSHFHKNFIDSYYVVALKFPGEGTVHSSGRQGIVYITNNGSYVSTPNNANRTFHMTCDISVVHAQDFSSWRWIELGDPFYERREPPSAVDDPLITEDYKSLDRGFNLHPPNPNPFNETVSIPINVFDPGYYSMTVYGVNGQKVATLFEDTIKNIGVRKISWSPGRISSGIYFVVAEHGNNMQTRSISYIK